jgi:hypothetical protein
MKNRLMVTTDVRSRKNVLWSQLLDGRVDALVLER